MRLHPMVMDNGLPWVMSPLGWMIAMQYTCHEAVRAGRILTTAQCCCLSPHQPGGSQAPSPCASWWFLPQYRNKSQVFISLWTLWGQGTWKMKTTTGNSFFCHHGTFHNQGKAILRRRLSFCWDTFETVAWTSQGQMTIPDLPTEVRSIFGWPCFLLCEFIATDLIFQLKKQPKTRQHCTCFSPWGEDKNTTDRCLAWCLMHYGKRLKWGGINSQWTRIQQTKYKMCKK